VTQFVWDASDFDWPRGPMDLRAARGDGIVGFTHKATEATWVKHVHTGEALARARDAGLEFIGAYHVVRSTSPAAQVDYFLSYLDQVAPWWRSFPGFFLQVDLELWPYDRVTAATGMEFARLLVAAQPKRVITYASRGQYGNSLAGIVTPLWNAAYGLNPAVHYPDAYRGDGSANWAPYSGLAPVLWQYGSQLRIGSQPTCDCSAFRGTLDELRALIGGEDMALTNEEFNMIRNTGYLVTGLVNMEDPIVVPPNPDSSYLGASLPNLLAQAIRALEAQAPGAGPTHDEMVEAAFEGAQRAEGE
jgi:hypothetical protein